MSRLLAAELVKLRTTRTFWIFGLAMAGLVAAIVLLGLATGDVTVEYATGDDQEDLFESITIIALLALILGVVGMTGEHRHGTITSTLLAEPDRIKVVVGKGIAYAAAGAALGLLGALITLAIAVPWFAAAGSGYELSATETLGAISVQVLYASLFAALGVGVGAVITNQTAAVVVVLVELFIVESVLAGTAPDVARYMPGEAGLALSGGDEDALSKAAGGALLVGYAAGFLALGAALMRRRDIT